jgi:hypothetical protein
MLLKWQGPASEYELHRDELLRLTRWGAEPVVLLPSAAFEGAGRLYHGRLGADVEWSRFTPLDGVTEAWRSWALPFAESPFVAP